jgi:hypothetical protein
MSKKTQKWPNWGTFRFFMTFSFFFQFKFTFCQIQDFFTANPMVLFINWSEHLFLFSCIPENTSLYKRYGDVFFEKTGKVRLTLWRGSPTSTGKRIQWYCL